MLVIIWLYAFQWNWHIWEVGRKIVWKELWRASRLSTQPLYPVAHGVRENTATIQNTTRASSAFKEELNFNSSKKWNWTLKEEEEETKGFINESACIMEKEFGASSLNVWSCQSRRLYKTYGVECLGNKGWTLNLMLSKSRRDCGFEGLKGMIGLVLIASGRKVDN